MNEIKTVNRRQMEMDDLVTGQLSLLAAWWLRRQIARSPGLAREFAEIQQMRDGLQSLAQDSKHPLTARKTAKVASEATITLGGFTMKRRIAVTACAAFVLTGSAAAAAVAYRSYFYFRSRVSVTHSNAEPGIHHDWEISGRFQGRVCVLGLNGRRIYEDPHPGENADAPMQIRFRRRKQSFRVPRGIAIDSLPYDVTTVIRGPGRHEIRDRRGQVVGTVLLSSWTEADATQVETEKRDREEAKEDFSRSPERLAPCWGRGSAELVAQGMGAVAGRSPEQGASWKVMGYADVEARYRTGIRQHQKSYLTPPLKPEELAEYLLQLPPRERESAERHLQRMISIAPKPEAPPVIYWAFAGGEKYHGPGLGSYDPVGDYAVQAVPKQGGYLVDKTGRWPQVRRSGQFMGYGKHEVKDENGKTVLVLTVSPLTPAKTAR